MNAMSFSRVEPGVATLVCSAVLTWLVVGCSTYPPAESGSPTPAAAERAATETEVVAAATERAATETAVTSAPVEAKREPAVAPPPAAEWTPLFDGTSLEGWRVTDFAGRGEVEVQQGQMILRMGAMLTGVNLVATNDLPTTNYELALEAAKLEGSDFFCALTFPVGDSCCTFLLGGWGGGVVGISSIDGNDASLNETTKYLDFERDRWYAVRVRVTPAKLEAWIGDRQMVDVTLEGKRISVRPGEIELSQPWGIAAWQTTGAIRSVRWRRL